MRRYTLNPTQQRRLDAPVASVRTLSGRVSVFQHPEGKVQPVTLEPRETLDTQNQAGIVLTAIGGGAKVCVVYEDEVTSGLEKPLKAPKPKPEIGRAHV